MLDASAQRIIDTLPADAVVLDVGGAMKPFNRADWIMDALPYEERGALGNIGGDSERFSAETWVRRDFCDREPWPFADKQLDFVICSHTLEDVRDPIWMCSEMNRIAKAGYIEVPSRLEEQSYGFQGPWTGWSHHRWLIDIDDTGVTFVHKSAVVERDDSHFAPGFRDTLSAEDRVSSLWWDDSFGYRERLFWDPMEFDAWLREPLLARELPGRSGGRSRLGGLRLLRGRGGS
jgi:Methyltransferase domain